MLISTEKISPSMAEKILSTNPANRNVRENLVDFYADQMKRGNWQVNGEAIKIAKDGTLLDGQHRLLAIMKYGQPVEMTVIRGLSKDVMPTIDIGSPRSVADHLTMKNIKGNVKILAAAIRLCRMFIDGTFVEKTTLRKSSPTDTINFIERQRGILRSLDSVTAFGKPLQALLPPAVAVAMHFLFSRIDPMKTEAFFTQLASGEGLKKDDPVLVLRVQLIGMRLESKRNRYNQKFYMYYMCQAFKYFLEGRVSQQTFKYNPNTMTIDLPGTVKKRKR